MRKFVCFAFCSLIPLAVFTNFGNKADAQAAPGLFSDANHPSGAPDPEKLDTVWQVDPITDQVSIKIPFNTTPQGGRGPKVPFSLLYNSASTVSLQALGTYDAGFGALVSTLKWSANPVSTPIVAPAGPWTTSGPYFYNPFTDVPNTSEPPPDPQSFVGCEIDGPFTYVDADGASHDLNLLQFLTPYGDPAPPNQSWMPACGTATNNSSGYWPSSSTTDGSALATSGTSVTEPDGTVVGSSAITDTNNNSASFSSSNGTYTVKDSALGRLIYSENIAANQYLQLAPGTYTVTTYSATSGTPENYSVVVSNESLGSFPNYGSSGMAMPHPDPSAYEVGSPTFCMSASCSTTYTVAQPQAGDGFTAITKVTLPDGTYYKFAYDSVYGTISKITFPTGGYVRFVWGIRDKDWTPYGQFSAISAIVVTDAYISPSGSGSDENHWGYTPGNSGTPASLSTSSTPIGYVYAPDGSYTSYKGQCTFNFTAVPFFNIGPRRSCKDISHSNYSSSGTLLASEIESYTSQGLTQQVNSTLYGGSTPMQKEALYSYDGYSNVTEKDESDYYSCSGNPCSVTTVPSGKWLRHTYTQYSYATASNAATLLSKHIVSKPSQVYVDASTTASPGVPASLASYVYDNNGNLTSQTKCSSGITYNGASSAATCSVPVTDSFCYDTHGQLTLKIEGSNLPFPGTAGATCSSLPGANVKGTITQYIWGPPQSGLTTITEGGQNLNVSQNGYLTTVKHPNGSTDTYTYSPYTGQMLSHTGWNTGQVTNYSYINQQTGSDDLLNRVGTIALPPTPDGTCGNSASGTTTYTYTDSANSFAVQEQHTVDSCSPKTQTSVTKNYDGLGRVANALSAVPTIECTSGVMHVDTTYDSVGRVASVSNSYCTTGDSTYGMNQFAYDGISRKIQTIYPDGFATNVTYGGPATKTADPFNGTTNVAHIEQVNGIGQLVSVCEVTSSTFGSDAPTACGQSISATGFLTSYSFNAIDDMTGVSQHGLSRSFSFDYLSRLTNATNPEAGAMAYTYSTSSSACAADPTLPCQRTDARGVNTNYTYDTMGRLISKSYTLATTNTVNPPGTPLQDLVDCYQYDTAFTVPFTDSNPAGTLTAEWQLPHGTNCPTTAQTTPPSNAVSMRIKTNHDLTGRVGIDYECPAGPCPSTIPSYPAYGEFVYSYNLLGNQVQANNGFEKSGGVLWSDPGTTNGSPASTPSVTWRTTYDVADQIVQTVVQDQPGVSVWPSITYGTNPTLLSATKYDPFGHLTGASLGVPSSGTAAATQTRSYDMRGRITSEQDKGQDNSNEATQSLGAVQVSGAEQSGDTGNITVTINGTTTAPVTWGSGSTPSSVAAALATAIQNADSGSSGFLQTVLRDGNVEVLTSKSGTSTNWTITSSVNDTAGLSPSFAITAQAFVGGTTAGGTHNGVLYSYQIPDGGYAPNGDILVHSDSVMGDWMFTYDTLDRLSTSIVTSAMNSSTDPELPNYYSGMYGCWSYDSLGNRTAESMSFTPCTSNPPQQSWATYNEANNRITSMYDGVTNTPVYDASGNVIQDGRNEYWYDVEGRICASYSGSGNAYQYVYDAEGARIEIGTLTSAPPPNSGSTSPTCAAATTANGFSIQSQFLVDLGGDQVTELDVPSPGASLAWAHSNTWLGGKNLVAYDGLALHFNFQDPLGSKRVVANILGEPDEMCTSLPFGNDVNNLWTVNCAQESNSLGTASDPSEHHFSQKERDTESGNDYFLARYYSSAIGRFMSPDWSTKVTPVPYATFADPQSLNLYAYVRNNPLIRADLDGHDFAQDAAKDWILKHQIANASLAQLATAGLERHLFMVGDAGLGHHNQGRNFARAANTAADEAWKNGEVPTLTRVSSGEDIAKALTSNGPLSGADYFGHASGDRLYPGETAISGSNLDQSNVGSLSSKNMDKAAIFTIHACFAGSGGSDGIAGMIANQLRRTVRAYDGPTIFSSNPLGPDGRIQPPAQGPLYLVPDHGTHLVEAYPQ